MTASPYENRSLFDQRRLCARIIVEQKRQKNVMASRVTGGMHERFLQNKNLCAFDRDTGQGSRAPRSRIDVHPVNTDIRMRHRSMSMHNEFAMVPRRTEELVAYPEQIIRILG